MAITAKDMKILWGRAASRCSICRMRLAQDKIAATSSYPIGEQAHIIGKREDSARGDSKLSSRERDSYHNLILLCPTHHTEIDKNPEDFPVEKLYFVKSRHELWVQEALEKETEAERDYVFLIELLFTLEDVKPILYWNHKSVPEKYVVDFLYYLHKLWRSSNVTRQINSNLSSGLEQLLRPIATGSWLEEEGAGYSQGKLWEANEAFAYYFKGRGFDWDNFKLKNAPLHMMKDIQHNADAIQKESLLLDESERNVLILILFITEYCRKVWGNKNYLPISEPFVRHCVNMIEAYCKSELRYSLPDSFDSFNNDMLRELIGNPKIYYKSE